MTTKFLWRGLALFLGLMAAGCCCSHPPEGYRPLFDGSTLNGWQETHKTKGPPYYVKHHNIISPTNAANDLVTDEEFSNFSLRLQFKLTPAANNGIGVRVPMETNDLTYAGNEIQILDDSSTEYANLEPGQYCGSVYKIFAAERGALKPVGKWNSYEITETGPYIKVVLNGKTIVDGDLSKVTDPEIHRIHYGMMRPRGHIALLGHWSQVEFRNIWVKRLPE